MTELQTTPPKPTRNLITIDPETLGGTPGFKGTRVPVESLFGHLKKGISLDKFLGDFPSVTREQVLRVIEAAGHQFVQQLEHGTVGSMFDAHSLNPN